MPLIVRYAPPPTPPEVVVGPVGPIGQTGKPGAKGANGADGAPGADLVDSPVQTVNGTGTVTLNLAISKRWRINAIANFSIDVSNAQDGDKVYFSVTQDATGGRTITWIPTIRWAFGGAPPTPTATADKRDTFGLEYFAADTSFDGFVVGQNI